MLNFKQQQTKVVIEVNGPYPVSDTAFIFANDCGDEVCAKLLWYALSEALRTRAREIKAQAYRAGYRDGRAKRQRRQNGILSDLSPNMACSDGHLPS